jgi:hypothetical protein
VGNILSMVINKEQVLLDFKASRIPITLRIGVTGHRLLEIESLIKESVLVELTKLDEILSKEFPHSPHVFVAVSPLAEGSDRLVAHEVLGLPATDRNRMPILAAVLSMPEEIYTRDFTARDH